MRCDATRCDRRGLVAASGHSPAARVATLPFHCLGRRCTVSRRLAFDRDPFCACLPPRFCAPRPLRCRICAIGMDIGSIGLQQSRRAFGWLSRLGDGISVTMMGSDGRRGIRMNFMMSFRDRDWPLLHSRFSRARLIYRRTLTLSLPSPSPRLSSPRCVCVAPAVVNLDDEARETLWSSTSVQCVDPFRRLSSAVRSLLCSVSGLMRAPKLPGPIQSGSAPEARARGPRRWRGLDMVRRRRCRPGC